jgi:hypothetical protein
MTPVRSLLSLGNRQTNRRLIEQLPLFPELLWVVSDFPKTDLRWIRYRVSRSFRRTCGTAAKNWPGTAYGWRQ